MSTSVIQMLLRDKPRVTSLNSTLACWGVTPDSVSGLSVPVAVLLVFHTPFSAHIQPPPILCLSLFSRGIFHCPVFGGCRVCTLYILFPAEPVARGVRGKILRGISLRLVFKFLVQPLLEYQVHEPVSARTLFYQNPLIFQVIQEPADICWIFLHCFCDL